MAVLRWETPRLHAAGESGEAKVTSVDLFYDLIFAVVIAQLATALAQDITPGGLATFVLLSVPAVRLWISQTLYSDRFEALDVSYRLFVFSAMLPAAGLAIAAPEGLGAGFPLFAVSVAVGRAVLVGQWLRSARSEPRVRGLAVRYLAFYALEDTLWIAAILAPAARIELVVAAILVDLVLPLTTTGLQADLGEFSQEHLGDRFGAFFLVVLGQLIIVAILVMTRMRRPSLADLGVGVIAFGLAFVLWWEYVDHVVERPLRPGAPWNAVWVYLHIPLFLGVAALGSGVLTFVTRGEAVVSDPARLLLCGSFAVAVVFDGIAELALVPLVRSEGRVRRMSLLHVVPAVLAVLLGVFGHGLTAIPLTVVLLAIGVYALVGGEYLRAG